MTGSVQVPTPISYIDSARGARPAKAKGHHDAFDFFFLVVFWLCLSGLQIFNFQGTNQMAGRFGIPQLLCFGDAARAHMEPRPIVLLQHHTKTFSRTRSEKKPELLFCCSLLVVSSRLSGTYLYSRRAGIYLFS